MKFNADNTYRSEPLCVQYTYTCVNTRSMDAQCMASMLHIVFIEPESTLITNYGSYFACAKLRYSRQSDVMRCDVITTTSLSLWYSLLMDRCRSAVSADVDLSIGGVGAGGDRFANYLSVICPQPINRKCCLLHQ